MMSRAAIHLVLGCTGAGKTTLIRALLAQRPTDERWAVMINDFGRERINTQPGVTLREVAGCVCCTAQVALRTALVQLLRATRLQRVFIEASASARPAALLALLGEPGIASAIELRPMVCVIDPLQLADSRFSVRENYGEQIASAARLIANRRSDADRSDMRALLNDRGFLKQGQVLFESITGAIERRAIL